MFRDLDNTVRHTLDRVYPPVYIVLAFSNDVQIVIHIVLS